ncbi:MAG: murein hydrolase activator EnvC family protein [bacterium]
MRNFVGIVLLLVAMFSLGVYATDYETQVKEYEKDIKHKEQELNNLKRELERSERARQEANRRRQSLTAELGKIDRDLNSKEIKLQDLEAHLKASRSDAALLAERISAEEERLSRLRDILRERLLLRYKEGNFKVLEILLGSRDFADYAKRTKYMRIAIRQGTEVFFEFAEKKALLERKKSDLERKISETVALRNAILKEKQRIEDLRSSREQLLAEILGKEENLRDRIRELRAASEGVERLILRMIEKKNEAESFLLSSMRFSDARGKLIWPVSGEVVGWYGMREHPKYKRILIPNEGIDIKAPLGADIVAVMPGEVEYVGWQPTFGKMVILKHGDGYRTIYAHTQEILVKPGDIVEQRQVIAKVGDTESLFGPILHFEIREGTRGKSMDPIPWLRQGGNRQ